MSDLARELRQLATKPCDLLSIKLMNSAAGEIDRLQKLQDAIKLFIRQREPAHTAPACMRLYPPLAPWTKEGCEENCSLCILNRALEEPDES